jgi:hypothetical protein
MSAPIAGVVGPDFQARSPDGPAKGRNRVLDLRETKAGRREKENYCAANRRIGTEYLPLLLNM